MRSATWAIVLILLSAHPAELSAQDASNTQQPEASARTTSSSPAIALHNPTNRSELGKKPDGTTSIVAVVGSLMLVLGVFLAVAWVFRRMLPSGAGPLPPEVFEVLGRAPLANRQQAHLLRCGNKVLLVSAGVAGVSPLAEITDPAEVDRLTDLCRQARPNVAATAFRNVFRQKGKSNG